MSHCPVCGSHNSEFYGEVKRFNPPLHYLKCLDCESLWQPNPISDPDSYYEEDYYSGNASFAYHDGRKSYKADRIVHYARIRTILEHLANIRGTYEGIEKTTFLDVGCAFGSFVRSCASYGPAYGLDVSRYSVTAGNEWIGKDELYNFRGLHRGSLWHLPPGNVIQENFFDVITLIEVAEHLHNPQENFISAYKLLKPGGILVIQTANFSAWQAINEGLHYHYLLPGHLTCYSSGGLIALLKAIGFSKFIEHIPVDFSLWAKLKKAGYGLKFLNLPRMLKVAKYHLNSKKIENGRPQNASWVLYAIKNL